MNNNEPLFSLHSLARFLALVPHVSLEHFIHTHNIQRVYSYLLHTVIYFIQKPTTDEDEKEK